MLAPPSGAAEFGGGFDGIGEAAGMTLTLTQSEKRVVGRFTTPGGTGYTLNGERADVYEGSAQGALRAVGADNDGAFFHIEERPLGLQFLFIPAGADGTPDLGSAREYSFLKRGVRPTITAEEEKRYRPAPSEPVDILVFLDGFRGWSPSDTARLYAQLDDRNRGLILLYDHATAELMWRICEAAPAEASLEAIRLAEMQERQHTECTAYLQLVEAARNGGLFPEFLRRSQFQLELVRATVLCDRRETAAARCADVSALGAPLILRWRRAEAIMGGLVPADQRVAAQPTAETEEAIPEEAPSGTGLAVPPEIQGPVPLARPGGNPSTAEGEFVSDFEPDVAATQAREAANYRLPLARPR
ncbi:hypothetical protein [Parvibaculum lavamentivorans]|nr:hypothetical protein [Parvibaculum lavamentivorans]